MTTATGSCAPRDDSGKWAHAAFDLMIPALDRPRTITVEYGDGTHSEHTVSATPSGGDPFHVAIQHWYPNAYDADLDYANEGPIRRRIRLKAYDVDDGGSHYLTFHYDAQPASHEDRLN